jgi:hypothetical protein
VVPAMWEAIGRSISLGLAKAKMWDLTWIITKSKRAGNMYQLESACLASIKPVFKPSTISYTHTHTHTHTHTNQDPKPGTVIHACNPCFLEGRNSRITVWDHMGKKG